MKNCRFSHLLILKLEYKNYYFRKTTPETKGDATKEYICSEMGMEEADLRAQWLSV